MCDVLAPLAGPNVVRTYVGASHGRGTRRGRSPHHAYLFLTPRKKEGGVFFFQARRLSPLALALPGFVGTIMVCRIGSSLKGVILCGAGCMVAGILSSLVRGIWIKTFFRICVSFMALFSAFRGVVFPRCRLYVVRYSFMRLFLTGQVFFHVCF